MRLIPIILAMTLLASGPVTAGSLPYRMAASSDLTMAPAVIMSAGSRASAVRALRKVPSVGVVNLNIRHNFSLWDDSSAPDVREFRLVAAHHAAGIRKLRAALSANPVTRKALARRGIPVSRVVGVRIGSNGSLRLYLL